MDDMDADSATAFAKPLSACAPAIATAVAIFGGVYTVAGFRSHPPCYHDHTVIKLGNFGYENRCNGECSQTDLSID